jgi:4-amino-4-deoxy-L-arabinose transferase-like glycosyltransferase
MWFTNELRGYVIRSLTSSPRLIVEASRSWIIQVLPYVLIGCVALPLLVFRLDTYPSLWFDEGYKLNAARTLAERGLYGTYTVEGYLPFDPGISGGPADIGLIALSFKLFGPGVLPARLMMSLYALLALWAMYRLATYLTQRVAATLIGLVILAAPSIQGVGFILIGRQVLAEMPALALILLGVWWWVQSWEAGRKWSAGLALLAGMAMGLGILSKTQIAIALVPALTLTAGLRIMRRKFAWWLEMLPVVSLLGVYGVWSLIGKLLTPADLGIENAAMLRDAIQSNLLTPLLGNTLTQSAWSVLAVMLTSIAVTGLRLWRSVSGTHKLGNADWLELFLAIFVLFTALWFALLSVGWPRYAFAGLMVSWLLLGRAAWGVLAWLTKQVEERRLNSRPGYRLALACLAIGAGVGNLLPILRFNQDMRVQAAADYIRNHVPASAVVETWEWELDALSGHWAFHHPHQRYLFLAIRQFSHERQPFALGYDALQADPDYLITGPFSDWTHLYDPQVVAEHFTEVAHIGAYRIYERDR